MTLANFMRKHRYLAWYVADPGRLDHAAIVEVVLNYGDWNDVQFLIRKLGMKKTAKIFRQYSHRPRTNYHPKIAHFFDLYFKRHAPFLRRNSHR